MRVRCCLSTYRKTSLAIFLLFFLIKPILTFAQSGFLTPPIASSSKSSTEAPFIFLTESNLNVANSQLKALNWLVGCWELKTNEIIFETKIDWAPGGSYLICRDFVRFNDPLESFDASNSSKRQRSNEKSSNKTTKSENSENSSRPNISKVPAFAALRVVGWNPISETFQTTIFFRDGGYGTAIWQLEGDDWRVVSRILLANGRAATSIERFSPRPRGFVWEATSRTIGNEPLPNVGPVEATPLAPEFFDRLEMIGVSESPAAATVE